MRELNNSNKVYVRPLVGSDRYCLPWRSLDKHPVNGDRVDLTGIYSKTEFSSTVAFDLWELPSRFNESDLPELEEHRYRYNLPLKSLRIQRYQIGQLVNVKEIEGLRDDNLHFDVNFGSATMRREFHGGTPTSPLYVKTEYTHLNPKRNRVVNVFEPGGYLIDPARIDPVTHIGPTSVGCWGEDTPVSPKVLGPDGKPFAHGTAKRLVQKDRDGQILEAYWSIQDLYCTTYYHQRPDGFLYGYRRHKDGSYTTDVPLGF